MRPVVNLPAGLRHAPTPRLLIINNMPAHYRTPPFRALLDEYSRRTGGSALVAYQVRRDSHGRGEWFFTPNSEFPFEPSVSARDTKASRRTSYPLRLDLALWRQFKPDHGFTAGWDSPLSLAAAAHSRVQRIQFRVWVDLNPTTSRYRGWPADLARRAFLRSADFAVVSTRASGSYVSALAGYDFPSVRLKNPVNWLRVSDSSDGCTSQRMVFIGDLTERKGFDCLARELAHGSSRGWVRVAYGRDLEGLTSMIQPDLSLRPATPLNNIVPDLLPTDMMVIPSRVDPLHSPSPKRWRSACGQLSPSASPTARTRRVTPARLRSIRVTPWPSWPPPSSYTLASVQRSNVVIRSLRTTSQPVSWGPSASDDD